MFFKYVYHEEFVSFFIMYQYDSLAPFQLKHEFTMVVAGPSKSGKTEFVKNLINNAHWISPPPERVVWCYREWQPAYESLKERVRFIQDIPGVLLKRGTENGTENGTEWKTE